MAAVHVAGADAALDGLHRAAAQQGNGHLTQGQQPLVL